jgi:multidrug efflux pump subunit AcrA (membrane-fusion protein)
VRFSFGAAVLVYDPCGENTMASIQEQIEALREKEAQLKARRQKLQATEEKAARKDRERRIFLIGAAIEAAVKRGEVTEAQVSKWLETGITRDWDREFLGLVKRPKS